MIFLKLLLLYSNLIFTIEAISWHKKREIENVKDRQNSTIFYGISIEYPLYYLIPLHYKVKINLYHFNEEKITRLSGKCIASILIVKPTLWISFHAQKPQIEVNREVSLIKANSNETYLGTYEKYEKDLVFFKLQEETSTGYYYLHINFRGSLNDQNFFQFSNINYQGEKSLLTVTRTFGARQLFPCWDDPAIKTDFQISLKHRISSIALSNTQTQEKRNMNYGIQWTHFEITPNISTNRVGFIILKYSDYIIFSLTNLWCRHEIVHQIAFTNNTIERIKEYIDYEWKSSLRNISNVQHVAIPGFPYNAIDKWNLIFYREADVVYDESIDSIAQKIEIMRLIAHNIVQQWMEVLPHPTWSYMWLNKAVATLLGTNIINKIFEKELCMMDLFVVQIQQESLRLDSPTLIGSVTLNDLHQNIDMNIFLHWYNFSENNLHISYFSYKKAPAILRMLQYILTNKAFQNGIETFYGMLKNHMFKTLDDFWYTMQHAYDKMGLYRLYQIDVKDKMIPWTRLEHYPVLMIRMRRDILMISVESVNGLNLTDKNLSIPITVTKESSPNFAISLNCQKNCVHWVSALNISYIPFDHNFMEEWIIVNLQQMGYYRVNYETHNWLNIERYLKNPTEYTKIHVLNRAQIIDDAYYFVKRKQMRLSLFLNITKYLSHETDYVAWYPMFKALEDMSNIFLFPDNKHIVETVSRSLHSLLRNITYKEILLKTDLRKCLQQEAVKWLCIFNDYDCQTIAHYRLMDYLNDPKKNKISHWWIEWMYINGFRSVTWNKMLLIEQETIDKWLMNKKILKSLINSRDPYMIENLLSKLKPIVTNASTDIAPLQDIEHINYFYNIIENHARDNTVLEYILQNLIEIKPRQLNFLPALIGIINNIYSEEQLIMIKQWIKDIYEKPGTFVCTITHIFLLRSFVDMKDALADKHMLIITEKINLRLSQIEHQMRRF